MASSAVSASPATRFEPYVEEVHSFFASCGVAFGSPEQMQPVTETLSSPGPLRDGVSSIVRAIVYREQEHISHEQLREVMLVAIGGPQFDLAPQLEECSRRLVHMIHEAMRFLWRMPSASTTEALRDEDPQAATEPARTQDLEPEPPLASKEGCEPSQQHLAAHPFVALVHKQFPTERDLAPSTDNRSIEDIASFIVHLDPVEASHRPLETSQPRKKTAAPNASSSKRHAPIRWLPAALSVAGVAALLLAPVLDMARQHRAGSKPGPTLGPTRAKTPGGRAPAPLPALAPPQAAFQPELVPMEEPPPASAEELSPASASRVHRKPAHPLVGQPATQTLTLAPATVASSNASEAPESAAKAGNNEAPAPAPERTAETVSPVAEASRQPRSVPESLMLGYLLSAPPPAYPRLAKMARVEGQVAVQAVVASDGSVASAHAVSGPRLLRGAAERAVRERRYRLYVADGSATPVRTVVTLDFRLHP